jgi:hypothetical protein
MALLAQQMARAGQAAAAEAAGVAEVEVVGAQALALLELTVQQQGQA